MAIQKIDVSEFSAPEKAAEKSPAKATPARPTSPAPRASGSPAGGEPVQRPIAPSRERVRAGLDALENGPGFQDYTQEDVRRVRAFFSRYKPKVPW